MRYGFRAKPLASSRDVLKTREEGFGAEVNANYLGTNVFSSVYDAYYTKAQKVRTLLKQILSMLLKNAMRFFHADRANVAFKIGEKSDDPLAMYLSDVYTASANWRAFRHFRPVRFIRRRIADRLPTRRNFWA